MTRASTENSLAKLADQIRTLACGAVSSVRRDEIADTLDNHAQALAGLMSEWSEQAAEERQTLRMPNVTIEEAHTCEPVARTWETAARELSAALGNLK